MIMASHQIFSGQIKHMSVRPLSRQIFSTLSMEILWSLQIKMNVQTIFSPYYKHCKKATPISIVIRQFASYLQLIKATSISKDKQFSYTTTHSHTYTSVHSYLPLQLVNQLASQLCTYVKLIFWHNLQLCWYRHNCIHTYSV